MSKSYQTQSLVSDIAVREPYMPGREDSMVDHTRNGRVRTGIHGPGSIDDSQYDVENDIRASDGKDVVVQTTTCSWKYIWDEIW